MIVKLILNGPESPVGTSSAATQNVVPLLVTSKVVVNDFIDEVIVKAVAEIPRILSWPEQIAPIELSSIEPSAELIKYALRASPPATGVPVQVGTQLPPSPSKVFIGEVLIA